MFSRQRIRIHLPQFYRLAANPLSPLEFYSTPAGIFDVVEWDATAEQIVILTDRLKIARDTFITFVVSSNSGIRLPAAGVTENQETLTVQIDQSDAPMDPMPVSKSSGLGAGTFRFTNSSLSFGDTFAGGPSAITFAFAVTLFLTPTDPGAQPHTLNLQPFASLHPQPSTLNHPQLSTLNNPPPSTLNP